MESPDPAAGDGVVEGIPHPRGICWSAVFAGLVVGMGTHLLLMLGGSAAVLATFGSGLRPVDNSLLITAAMWNTASMLVGAFVGGYVAARSAGLRRTPEGVLHGVVSWGATLVLVALLGGALGGQVMSGTLQASAGASSAASGSLGELVASLERGDRAAATDVLRSLGLDEEQAGRAVDQALTVRESREAQNDAAQAAAIAAAWLSVAALLSLLAGAAGGAAGVHGLRLGSRPESFSGPRVSPTIGPAPPPIRASDPSRVD